ncbi:hypothetical protein VMUT_0140 [Vulcanisaeta moutnovskia 768-28]|uniref:Uncharacterized protein n=1 Tax=Vulcanisaeta moutnovskia (strain 768-28) TaxID=985053 RepID=F0QST5_VULM7|nr:hypothetical protein [Vulcanisaeta moutnovskia]ADY00356.1 hypothetical protein VMUT_0140 [Vulcanisaeta moutnovskia 768-28]
MAQADKPRICWGVKRGRRLVCKELVTDEETIKEVLELVEELKRRVEKHRGKLETAAFIDELIDLLEQWLEEHKEDKGKKVKEARKIVRKMVELLEELREKWVKVYWRQLLELVELLERNAIDIVVTGKGNEKSLVVHIYSTDVTVKVTRVAKNGGITMHLVLSELEGDDVRVANMFSDEELLKAIQHGWEMTDGSVINDHPAMGTNQPWQAILWTLCYPGKIHVLIYGININENDVSVKWYLVAKDHEARSKEEAAKEVKNFDEERIKIFLASAIWGDGEVNVGERYVRLIMGLAKYDLWLGIIERLINELGFTIKVRDYKAEVGINSSKAVKLARDWLAMPDIRELIELGASLSGGEKLRRIIELANMEIKELGSRSILILGTNISMSIDVNGDCRVELRTHRKDNNEALKLIEELRKAGYKPSMYVSRGNYIISITHANVRDSPLKPIVCRKLGEWLNETKDERKERIAKAMQNLKCFDDT